MEIRAGRHKEVGSGNGGESVNLDHQYSELDRNYAFSHCNWVHMMKCEACELVEGVLALGVGHGDQSSD